MWDANQNHQLRMLACKTNKFRFHQQKGRILNKLPNMTLFLLSWYIQLFQKRLNTEYWILNTAFQDWNALWVTKTSSAYDKTLKWYLLNCHIAFHSNMASYNEQISVIFIRYLKLTRTAMPCGLGMQYSVCSIQYSTFFEIAIYQWLEFSILKWIYKLCK